MGWPVENSTRFLIVLGGTVVAVGLALLTWIAIRVDQLVRAKQRPKERPAALPPPTPPGRIELPVLGPVRGRVAVGSFGPTLAELERRERGVAPDEDEINPTLRSPRYDPKR